MSCPSATYAGGKVDHASFTNWSGRFSGPVNSVFTPNSLPDLVNVVQLASAGNHSIHVVGSGWAFENIAYSSDFMVSLANLKNPLNAVTDSALNPIYALRQTAGGSVLFHIEAGATVADVNDALRSRSLALPTLGGANGQALAGALTTGTHGGDITVPPLVDMVKAMHLVTFGGREVWIERASDPITDDFALASVLTCPDTEILRNDDVFNALLVGFGRFGVIYSYVLQVVPAFGLAEWTTKISRATLTANLRSGITAGTFLVPLFGVLSNPPATLGVSGVLNPRGLEIVFDTNNLGECFVKRRWIVAATPKIGGGDSSNPLCVAGATGVVAAATTVLSPFLAIPFYNVAVGAEITALNTTLVANPTMTAGEMLARVLTGFWQLGLGGSIPAIAGVEFGLQYQDSTTSGKRDVSDVIVSGSRNQSLQSCYRADSIEPVFDARQSGYIDFLDEVLNAAPNFKQAGYISLRWSAASTAMLSMHHFASGNAVAIEITSLRNLPDNAAWMTKVEGFATALMGRPHWGQINTLNATSVASLYGSASVAKWRSTLGAFVGSAGSFSNAYTTQRGLEPPTGATASIVGQRAGDLVAGFLPAIKLLLAK